MIFSLVRFLAKRHILLAIGALRVKFEASGKRANLTPNGVLQLPRESMDFLAKAGKVMYAFNFNSVMA